MAVIQGRVNPFGLALVLSTVINTTWHTSPCSIVLVPEGSCGTCILLCYYSAVLNHAALCCALLYCTLECWSFAALHDAAMCCKLSRTVSTAVSDGGRLQKRSVLKPAYRIRWSMKLGRLLRSTARQAHYPINFSGQEINTNAKRLLSDQLH